MGKFQKHQNSFCLISFHVDHLISFIIAFNNFSLHFFLLSAKVKNHSVIFEWFTRGAFRGKKRTPPPPPSWIRPPADSKDLPFVLFWDIHIWWRTLKIVYRWLWSQYVLTLRGERVPKKREMLVKIFPAAQKILTKQGLFNTLGGLGKSIIQFGRPESPTPRENHRSAPVIYQTFLDSLCLSLKRTQE